MRWLKEYKMLALLPLSLFAFLETPDKYDGQPVLTNEPAEVRVNFDGTSRKFISYSTFIKDAIKEGGIPFEEGDSTLPYFDELLENNSEIQVLRGRPVLIYDEGRVTKGKSGYEDPALILKQLGVEILDEDIVEQEVINGDFLNLGRVGRLVVVTRAPRVVVRADGEKIIFSTWDNTVGELLASRGIVLTGLDYVKPSLDTKLHAGMTVRVFRVREYRKEIRETTNYQTFTSVKTKISSSSNCQTRVTQKGQNGIKDVTYNIREEDNRVVSKVVKKTDIIQKLRHHFIVKDRIISSSKDVGESNWANYSGYTAAYRGFGGWPNYVGKKILVTNLDNGRQITAEVISYGPATSTGDILDLAASAFTALGGQLWQGELKHVQVQKILCEA